MKESCVRIYKGMAAMVIRTSIPKTVVLGKDAGLLGVRVLELGGTMDAI